MSNFTSPERLWILLAVVAAAAAYVVLQITRRHTYAVRFTNLDLLDKVAPSQPRWRKHVVAGTFLACLALQVIAFAQPTRSEKVPRERATVILAIDVSLSMEATDVAPSRLEGAKIAAKAFLDQVPARLNVGLVAFSQAASIRVSPTTDRDAVRQAIDALTLGSGTGMGEAISASLEAIKQAPGVDDSGKAPPGVIVLMSDGKPTGTSEAEANNRVENGIAQAKAADVPISTIAFGTPTGSIADPRTPGARIAVPADPATLAHIADATGGKTFDAQSTEALTKVFTDIGSAVGYTTEQRDISSWFVGFALLFALVTAAGSLVWFNRLP
jgi:Ca-activated chloride channel family protein